jgi:hypothetical protein
MSGLIRHPRAAHEYNILESLKSAVASSKVVQEGPLLSHSILCYPSLSVINRERVIAVAEEIQATEEILVHVIDKGLAGRIHIRLSKFRDRDYLDIRNFYEGEDGQWLPTRKGIAVPVELYGDLMTALGTAKELIDKRAKAS